MPSRFPVDTPGGVSLNLASLVASVSGACHEGGATLTGEICNQIDQIWNAFWSGGVSNPLSVGRGRKPLWLVEAVKKSAKQESFAV